MKNGSAVVKLLTTLVLLALMAPLDKNSHVKTYFFGSKTLILYDIYYGKLREFKDYLFPFSSFFFFFLKWDPLCWRLLILCVCLVIFLKQFKIKFSVIIVIQWICLEN